jgi:hypothetical protein
MLEAVLGCRHHLKVRRSRMRVGRCLMTILRLAGCAGERLRGESHADDVNCTRAARHNERDYMIRG